MKKYDVICAGLSTVDLIAGTLDGEVMQRDTTYLDTLKLQIGGDAVNQAVILSRLGIRCGLMALLGDDFWGRYLLNMLTEAQVDCSMVRMEKEMETTVSMVMLDEKRERHFAVKKGSMDYFGKAHLDFDAAKEASIVSIGSNLALKSLDGAATCELFAHVKKHGGRTAADYSIGKGDEQVNHTMLSEMFRQTDYIFPSYSEAVIMTGETEERRIAEALRDMGASNIVLKLGEKGCYLCSQNTEKHIAAYPAAVTDTTGAGDSFVSGFLYGLVKGKDVETCARIGCAAGSIATEAIGATTAVRNERQLLTRAGIS